VSDEPSLPYVAARLDRVVRSGVERAVSPFDLTVSQYTVLSVLARQPALSNAQLARRAFVSPQSMNETLLALEARQLVRRKADPNHGRIRRTELTAAGRRVVERCNRGVDEVEAAMTAGMTAPQRKVLRTLLMQAVRNLGGGFPVR
jgi:DNA-binding MarR family transcriptional regulator